MKTEPIVTFAEPECTTPYTEDALATLFTERYGSSLRYVHKWRQWYRWSGTVWQEEPTMLQYDLARLLCREVSADPEVKEGTRRYLAQSSTVNGIVRMASADRQHAATANQWDTKIMELNTASGIVNLLTGEVGPHDPKRYHSKITATGLSDAEPELWLTFLDRIFEDKGLIPYVQRLCGYLLTGSTVEHALFFLYGTGANGKSTLVKTVSGILGDYAREASLQTFIETNNPQHPCGLAVLQGSRMALIPETERHSYWAESTLKQCTGGDRITARRMHADFFDFTPQFKLTICGNHKPRLRSVDEAIRRRLHLIPFTVTIPAEERDPALADRLVAEWPAILNWMVQGCQAWQEHGLDPPECVTTATNEYLDSQDKVGRWLEERCVVGPQESALSGKCWEDFKSWCENGGEQASSNRSLTDELTKRPGIRKGARSSQGNVILGISLKSDRSEEWQDA